MECSRCHQEKATAVSRLNPYEADVNGVEQEEILCDACYDALCDEV